MEDGGGCGPSVAACLGNDEPNVTAVLSPRTSANRRSLRRQTTETDKSHPLEISPIQHHIGQAQRRQREERHWRAIGLRASRKATSPETLLPVPTYTP